MKFTKLRAGIAAVLLAASALAVAPFAGASIQLGGSIFPLTFISQQPLNLVDGFNQMLSIINQQVMPSSTVVSAPGGRLSLTSVVGGVPTTDVALESNVFYMPYTTQLMPVYNGTAFSYVDFGSSGLQLTLGSSDTAQSGSTPALYDVYGFLNNGAPTICKTAWGGTSRSSTAGGGTNGTGGSQDVRVTQLNGIWVNRTAMATGNCFGGSGTNATPVSYTFGANQGTLLGTINLPSTGGISQLCRGAGTLASAAGGLSSAGVNLSNAYNRVPINCSNINSAQTTSASASWAAMGNNDAISWVDSLAQVPAFYTATVQAGTVAAANAEAEVGVGYASNSPLASTGTPNIIGAAAPSGATLASNWQTVATSEGITPVAGLNTIWLEKASGAGTSTYGLNSNGIGLNLNIMY
jgi:hypothetical protein